MGGTVTVFSRGANTTFVGNEEINFENGAAQVSREMAEELCARPGGTYYTAKALKKQRYDPDAPGSFEILHAEWRKLFVPEKYAKLRKWLTERMNELTPALFGIQQADGATEPPQVDPQQDFLHKMDGEQPVPTEAPASVDGFNEDHFVEEMEKVEKKKRRKKDGKKKGKKKKRVKVEV